MARMSFDKEEKSRAVVRIFEFEDRNFQVRTTGTMENPLFCIKDVCQALNIKNPRDKTALLAEDEKLASTVSTSGQGRKMTFCTLPGLFSIILSVNSGNERARLFRRWVCHDVLPTIQQTGSYTIPGMSERQLCLEEQKAETDYIKLMLEIKQNSLDDAQLHMIANDALKNKLAGRRRAIEGPQLKTLATILRDHGFAAVDSKLCAIKLGLKFSNLFHRVTGDRPSKVPVHVNGAVRPVNVYADTAELWELLKTLL